MYPVTRAISSSVSPADAAAMRGFPVVGPGIGGLIRGKRGIIEREATMLNIGGFGCAMTDLARKA